MERIVLSIISFDRVSVEKDIAQQQWLNMPVSSLTSPVPLDLMAAIHALKDSALHLDLYAWCLYHAYLLKQGGQPALVLSWNSFMMQLGCSYSRVRDFRKKVKKEFGFVKPFLKGVIVELLLDEGIRVHPAQFSAIRHARAHF